MSAGTDHVPEPPRFRALPLVPLVVLPTHVGRGAPRLNLRARSSLEFAVAALRGLHGALAGADSLGREADDAHLLALQAMRWLAASLDPLPHEPELDTAVDEPHVHVYFGVRTASLAPEERAAQATAVLLRTLADARYASLDVNDLAAEVDAMAAALDSFVDAEPRDRPEPYAWLPALAPTSYEPDGDGFERWIVAHHAYFFFNLHAAAEVRAATAGLRRRTDDPPERLRRARVFVRGFTAAMAHAAAISARYYQDVVRSSMEPPATPIPLTGSMQPEHASYRAAILELLEACPDSFAALARRDPELADERDELLHADLVDVERHVLVAEKLVGMARSLVQHDRLAGNAVTELRRIRDERATRYAPFLRFGERPVAQLVTVGAARHER